MLEEGPIVRAESPEMIQEGGEDAKSSPGRLHIEMESSRGSSPMHRLEEEDDEDEDEEDEEG